MPIHRSILCFIIHHVINFHHLLVAAAGLSSLSVFLLFFFGFLYCWGIILWLWFTLLFFSRQRIYHIFLFQCSSIAERSQFDGVSDKTFHEASQCLFWRIIAIFCHSFHSRSFGEPSYTGIWWHGIFNNRFTAVYSFCTNFTLSTNSFPAFPLP